MQLASLWSQLENKPLPSWTKSPSPFDHDYICNKFLNKIDEKYHIFNHYHKYAKHTTIPNSSSLITNIFPILNKFSLKNCMMQHTPMKWSQMTLDYIHYHLLKQEYLLLNIN